MEADVTLAARLALDLDGAFLDLLEAHQDRAYSIALRFLGNAHDAEEVAQDTFVRAHRAMRAMPPDEVRAIRLRPWLATIVIRLARNRRRRRSDREPAVNLDRLTTAGCEPIAARREEPEAAVEARGEAEALARHLAELPVAMRAAVVLHHVEGLTFPEIAGIVGAPEGTVRARAHRGLARLRGAIVAEAVRPHAPPRLPPNPGPLVPPPRRLLSTTPGEFRS